MLNQLGTLIFIGTAFAPFFGTLSVVSYLVHDPLWIVLVYLLLAILWPILCYLVLRVAATSIQTQLLAVYSPREVGHGVLAFFLNPLLASLGYHFYTTNYQGKGRCVLIARTPLEMLPSTVKAVLLFGRVYLMVD